MKKTILLILTLAMVKLSFTQNKINSKIINKQKPNKSLVPFKSSNEVTIGEQVWMTKNLNVDKFRNGDHIPEAKTPQEWVRAIQWGQPAWCYYENNATKGAKYGKLYNWYAVNDPRGLAPQGWKIPSDEDWSILTNFLGGRAEAGKKMKFTDFWFENNLNGGSGNGSNESRFSGLPGGHRFHGGHFLSMGRCGNWWTRTEQSTYNAWYFELDYRFSSGDIRASDKYLGMSVRCLRD
jgi:uncharacterized protein (TIGR02145 family)